MCYTISQKTSYKGDRTMHYLELISGPLIGGIIGYSTNYIAVKMLFRPLKPVKIGNYTLPFTPGIIPKRKDKLAEAILMGEIKPGTNVAAGISKEVLKFTSETTKN